MKDKIKKQPWNIFHGLENLYLKSLTRYNSTLVNHMQDYYKTYELERKFSFINAVGLFDEFLRKDYPPGWKDRNVGIRNYEKNPVLLLHGYAQNRGAFTDMAEKLRENGFSLVYRINHNPWIDIKKNIKYINSRVDHILEQTTPKSGKVDLIGHSLGGLTSRYYSYLYPEKVDYCIMIGAPHNGTYTAYLGLIGFLGRLRKIPRIDGMSCYQMTPGSRFLKEVNAMTPSPDVKYINIYTNNDEVIVLKDSEIIQHSVNINIKQDIGLDGIGHIGLIHDPRVIDLICEILSNTYGNNKFEKYYEDYDENYKKMIPVREN